MYIYLTRKLQPYFTILSPSEWPLKGALTSNLVITRQRKMSACWLAVELWPGHCLPRRHWSREMGRTPILTTPEGIVPIVPEWCILCHPPLPLCDPAALELLFFVVALLSCSSLSMAVHPFKVYSSMMLCIQSCAAITTINFQHFHHPGKKSCRYLLAITLPGPLICPALGDHWPTQSVDLPILGHFI